jgi:4'-phosphopantetheinyl transferase EntD
MMSNTATPADAALDRDERTFHCGQLFAPGVMTAEHWGAGSEAAMLPQEALCVAQARPKRRQEFAAGRDCARRALRALGIADAPMLINDDRTPQWPDGIVGSITHTGGYCAAAVARRSRFRGIGIDAEGLNVVEPQLWPDICTTEELAWLMTRPAEQRMALATLMFSAKEAFYKSQYAVTGRWVAFHEVTVTIGRGAFRARPRHELGLLSQDEALVGAYWIGRGLVVCALAIRVAPADNHEGPPS